MDAHSSCCIVIADEYHGRLFGVAGLLFADEYHGRLIRVAGLLFADEYHGRSFELLDSYSPTNTMDAYSSCWTPIRRRIPWTLIRVAVS